MNAVSVIIPVYNVEEYLAECLDSVLNQSLKEVEIICINDRSTDNSDVVLSSYASNNASIHQILHDENKGLSEARNSGIRSATGKYIFFLDSDDKIDSIALEKLCMAADYWDLDMICFDADVFLDASFKENSFYSSNDYQYSRNDVLDNDKIFSGKEFLNISVNENAYLSSACLSLYKREFLLENELVFQPDILHEDELFTIQALLVAERVKYYPANFLKRRLRSNSILNTTNSRKKIEDLLFITNRLVDLAGKCSSPTSKTIWKQIFKLQRIVDKHRGLINKSADLSAIEQILKQNPTWKRYRREQWISKIKRKLFKVSQMFIAKPGKYQFSRKIKKIQWDSDNDDTWSKADIESFQKVELIRKKYLDSKEVLEYRDYGTPVNKDNNALELMQGTFVNRNISEICSIAATPEKWGKLLYQIIQEYKPSICIELGTNLGISTAYQLLSLKQNGAGKLYSLEGAEPLIAIADTSLSSLGYDNYSLIPGKFTESLPKLLERIENIDFAFIDGHHDRFATLKYFNLIFPKLSENSIVIFDDIHWSPGMQKMWLEIKESSKIAASCDLKKWGICNIKKK